MALLAFILVDFSLESFLQLNLGCIKVSHLARISSLKRPLSGLLFQFDIDLAIKETF